MNILLHIPHAGLKVPKWFYKGLTISKDEFRKYNLIMSDLNVDYLFKDLKGIKIKSKYSRLFCDVERFRNDEDEVMSKYGEGVVYTRTYDGILFHNHDNKYKNKVLKYYDKYHKKLDKISKKLLKKDNTLLILDLHSFSDTMASTWFKEPFPDICIGVEEKYYDEKILHQIITSITNKGYTYKINHPYKGSLVPNIIYNNKIKGKVISIMIEVNKRVYL